jgi:hypothetical protein
LDYEEIIEAFRNGKLKVDCRSMTLTQRAVRGETYLGKGYIRQAEDGAVEFRLYVERTEDVKLYLPSTAQAWH